MEVTEIILAKILNFLSCRVTVAGFLLGPSHWISLAHKTPSCNKKNMLSKIFFDIHCYNFIISNNFEQNTDETDLKQPKIHRKIQEKSRELKV
jgi:hypothetical protein